MWDCKWRTNLNAVYIHRWLFEWRLHLFKIKKKSSDGFDFECRAGYALKFLHLTWVAIIFKHFKCKNSRYRIWVADMTINQLNCRCSCMRHRHLPGHRAALLIGHFVVGACDHSANERPYNWRVLAHTKLAWLIQRFSYVHSYIPVTAAYVSSHQLFSGKKYHFFFKTINMTLLTSTWCAIHLRLLISSFSIRLEK